jgi:phage shock protein A
MTESLVLRVKRLISGSANGVVDALETANAEIVMREAVREIERATDDVREELARAMTARHQTNRLLSHTKAKLAELSERAKFAVGQARDDLAEAALSRQLDLEAEIPVHEAKIIELTTKQTELEGYVASLATRKREMESEIAAFVAASASAARAAGSTAGPEASVASKAERRADQAQQAFERAMGSPAGAKPDRETAARLHELDRLSRSSKVAERLAQLKSGTQG